MKEVTKPELYKELSDLLLEIFTTKNELNTYDLGRLLNLSQRCRQGELGKKSAPNIDNTLAILQEKSGGKFTVQSLDLIKITNNETSEVKTLVIQKKIRYGNKYNRRIQKEEKTETAIVDNEPQNSPTEQGLPAKE